MYVQACGPACFWMKRFAHPSIEQKMIVICAQERTGWIQRLLKELFPLPYKWEKREREYLGYNPTRSMWCNHTLVRTQEASSTYIQTIISHHFAKGPANFPWILFLSLPYPKINPWYFIRSIQRILQEAFRCFSEIKPKFALYYLPYRQELRLHFL